MRKTKEASLANSAKFVCSCREDHAIGATCSSRKVLTKELIPEALQHQNRKTVTLKVEPDETGRHCFVAYVREQQKPL